MIHDYVRVIHFIIFLVIIIHSFIHLFIHSFIHSFIHALTHLLTDSNSWYVVIDRHLVVIGDGVPTRQ